VACHLIARLTPTRRARELVFKNEVFGPLPEEHREHMKEGMGQGWSQMLSAVKRELEG